VERPDVVPDQPCQGLAPGGVTPVSGAMVWPREDPVASTPVTEDVEEIPRLSMEEGEGQVIKELRRSTRMS
jgi:hypothetical protein